MRITVESRRRHSGFTLVEMLIAVGLGSIALTIIAMLSMFASRSFESLANYAELDARSRNALDRVSREMRQCTALISFQTNAPVKFLMLTNADQNKTITLTWNQNDGTLVMGMTGDDPQILLKSCDRWDIALYSRAPVLTPTNITFYPATNSQGNLDATKCKLIGISWQCSRAVLGNKINTESVQTAQIVLRNKVQ